MKPWEKGELSIELPAPAAPGAILELQVDDPRGFPVNEYRLPVGKMAEYIPPPRPEVRYEVTEADGAWNIDAGGCRYRVDTRTGLLTGIAANGAELPVRGPWLMALALDPAGDTQMHGPTKYDPPATGWCTQWQPENVRLTRENDLPLVTVTGRYREAAGTFRYRFGRDGCITVEYDFRLLAEELNPRQTGVVFELPGTCEFLRWERKGFWTTYPEWHIGRLQGEARASDAVAAAPTGPRTRPEHEWRKDQLEIGSNDFCSTKHNIFRAALDDGAGHGVEVAARGDRHVRAWRRNGRTHLLIAGYSNGGGERFLRELAKIDERPLKQGDPIRGSARISAVLSWPVTTRQQP